MNVKGTTFVTAKSTITAAFGAEKWNSFMSKLAAKDIYFKNMIMSITLIPEDKFILFFDELIKEFFNNDKEQYLLFGLVAAQYALSPGGPYHSYLLTKDLKQFVESGLSKLWATYYDKGEINAKLENNVVHIKITGLTIKYYYFETLCLGFFKQALKLFGKKSIAKRIKSLSSGDDYIYFTYELKES